MTHEDSNWIIRRKKRKEQELGFMLVIALLCMSALFAYGL